MTIEFQIYDGTAHIEAGARSATIESQIPGRCASAAPQTQGGDDDE